VAWCLRIAGDRDDAHDLAQAVFAKAYRHLGSFRGDSRWSTWLYAITRSECMNFLEAKRGRPIAVSDDEAAADVPSGEEGVDLTLERQGAARAVHALLDETLNETEKRIFTLHYGEDVPLQAITRLLGLKNRSGAKAYIVSARRKLARALRSWKARGPALDV
jgi:RNA polymerase sigma-70 factor, ECF subfamily